MINAPQLPPPTLAPIQPQYDISPPVTRPSGGDDLTVAGSLPGVGSGTYHTPKMDNDPGNDLFGNAPMQDTVGASEIRTREDRSSSGYKASEEIAALGLAALDGAQEEEEHAEVKTEAQSATSLATVPAAKPTNRPHRPPNAKPSEGSSDKRFLCYICIKLFTRRRSVRDHIKKIHNDTNFDMARAIEVTVDPETGESVIPLEELVKTLPPPSGSQQTQTGVPHDASHPTSRGSSVDTNTFSNPAPVAGKKRPAPGPVPLQTTAMKKKGTAKPQSAKSGSKKVKPEIEISTETAAAFRSPSGTPVSSRASKPPTAAKLKKQPSMSVASSPAPSERMSVDHATDNEAEDEANKGHMLAQGAEEKEGEDDEVFCICRKGDNHTWMIGCDGGCEDWFHGRCVNIQERDGDLIDKYICPKCEENGRGQTTWKRMCRRKECRKPARVLAEPPSKYCSDECKKRFWVGMVKKSDPNAIVSEDGLLVIGSKVYQKNKEKKKRKRKKPKEDEEYHDTNNQDESEYHEEAMQLSPSSRKKKKTISPTMTKSHKGDYRGGDAISSDDEPPLPTRGGALSVGDIKMMLNQAKTVDEIRRLGQKPPTPPYTSDLDADELDTKMAVDGDDQQEPKPFPYNPDEQVHLQRLSAKKRSLQDQLQLLRDQEKLLSMIKMRSAAIIEGLPKKGKNVCGFDDRLSWSTAEFEDWRSSAAGRGALEKGVIGDPVDSNTHSSIKKEDRSSEDAMLVDGVDNELVDGYGDDEEAEDEDEEGSETGTRNPASKTTSRGICIRNKCPRHREWRRLMASEYKFEEEGVRRQMRKLDAEARQVRERAAMRVLCEQE